MCCGRSWWKRTKKALKEHWTRSLLLCCHQPKYCWPLRCYSTIIFSTGSEPASEQQDPIPASHWTVRKIIRLHSEPLRTISRRQHVFVCLTDWLTCICTVLTLLQKKSSNLLAFVFSVKAKDQNSASSLAAVLVQCLNKAFIKDAWYWNKCQSITMTTAQILQQYDTIRFFSMHQNLLCTEPTMAFKTLS